MGVSGRRFRNAALLAISASWMPSGLVLLTCRAGTDCFGLRDWSAMKLAEKQSQSGEQGGGDGKLQGAVCAFGGAGSGQDDPPMFGNACARTPPWTNAQDQSRFAEVLPAPQFAHQILASEPNSRKRPIEFYRSAGKKMLRRRSHFRESIPLVLRPERHKTLEILQHHRASSEANPIRPRLVPIRNGCEIAACGLGHFQERRFQNRGTLEIRLGF